MTTKRLKLPADQRFIKYLAETCTRLRREAKINRKHVATRARCDPVTLWRFEDRGLWPQRPDEIVAAYAEMLGMPDARVIWEGAVKLWTKSGASARPVLPGTERDDVKVKTATDVVRLILEQRQSGLPARDHSVLTKPGNPHQD